MTIKRGVCLLCQVELQPDAERGVQIHPPAEDCNVKVTDEWGIALDEDTIAALEVGADDKPQRGAAFPLDDIDGLILQRYPLTETVIGDLFRNHNLPRLGGQSTGRGWSSFALWQRCPYAWKRRYVEKQTPLWFTESEALAVGTLIHLFLALHFTSMMDSPFNVISSDAAHEYLLNNANPSFVNEGWRVFKAYRLFYQFEEAIPLAVEHDARDPRTGESCRYDAIVYFPKEAPGRLPGTYYMEHKSTQRFDLDNIEGWANDGEVIGQAALWKRLGLDYRFGPLKGAIVNLLGKQKEPKFHRTLISPTSLLVGSHLDDLKRWEGLMQLAKATNNFPRARNNCIGRWGRCDWWEHCSSGEA
jgi:hypothetical protein